MKRRDYVITVPPAFVTADGLVHPVIHDSLRSLTATGLLPQDWPRDALADPFIFASHAMLDR